MICPQVTCPQVATKVTNATKAQKSAQKAKAKSAKPDPRLPRLHMMAHHHFWFSNTNFNILPKGTFHPIVESHLTQIPQNLTKRHTVLTKEFPINPKVSTETIDWSLPSRAKSTAIRKAIAKVLKARFLFRKLLHHMRIRLLKVANTEDIFTMEAPKKLVELVDWPSKQKYSFEAATLMKDITCRLMNHDGFFQDPQQPRNPFTNIPFTQAQAISLWNSISAAGIPVSVAFTAFRLARYKLCVFSLHNSSLIKLNALKKTMRNQDSYLYREKLLDFITFCYSEEILACSVTPFSYCLINYPNHPQICRWAKLCQEFYEAEILYSNDPDKLLKIKDYIFDLSVKLINTDSSILNMYSASVNFVSHVFIDLEE
jgi:hypothetical protein